MVSHHPAKVANCKGCAGSIPAVDAIKRKETLNMKNKPLPIIKLCPICGSAPQLKIEDMGLPGGHGYPGCYSYTMSCPHCDLPKHVGSDTVYRPQNDAHRKTIEDWNKEVERIQKFLDERKEPYHD